MAELEMEIEAAKLMLYKAATDKQEGEDHTHCQQRKQNIYVQKQQCMLQQKLYRC